MPGLDVKGTDLRAESRSWFESNWAPDLTLEEWWDRLVSSGWGFPTYRTPFGRGLSARLASVVDEERRAVGAAPAPDRIGAKAITPLLFEYGTDAQVAKYVPDTLRDRAVWCELFSEPGAGSDLAGLSTRAVPSGSEWIVNGQKVWSSGAQFARWGLLVARTDPTVPKQHGLTCFVLDMHQPGVDVRPLVTMTGEAEFNEVFLTDAVVARDDTVGGVGDGWIVVKAALGHERRAMGGDGLGDNSRRPDLSLRAGDLAGRPRGGLAAGAAGDSLMRSLITEFGLERDPLIRQEMARVYTLLVLAKWTTRRAKASRSAGPESAIGRLVTSEIARAQRDLYLRLEGAAAMLAGADAPHGGVVQRLALWTPAMSIMLGTDEVQRNLIGERTLGLPREPDLDHGVPWRDVRRS